ncbi:MAG: hypothetical protein FWC18_02010 [Cystobacterineae bacterium]|nr:hypothetical protein [Cystobacterineae bacterium]
MLLLACMSCAAKKRSAANDELACVECAKSNASPLELAEDTTPPHSDGGSSALKAETPVQPGKKPPTPTQSCLSNTSCAMSLISTSSSHTVALKRDGTVWVWGDNFEGHLGDGTRKHRSLPVQVRAPSGKAYLTDIIAVAAGGIHTAVLKSDGTVWVWGNGKARAADGTAADSTNSKRPMRVGAPPGEDHLSKVTAIAAATLHTVALKSDGTVWTWGYLFGLKPTVKTDYPWQVLLPSGAALTDVMAVAAGGTHTAALRSNDTVWTWGSNEHGQLGDGTTEYRNHLVQVVAPSGSGHLSGVVALAVGESHTVALKSDGTVWAWGDNEHGQLGDGTKQQRSRPVQVLLPSGAALTGVIAIAAGSAHTLALKSDGTVWAWGDNEHGQLGDGTTKHKSCPEQVSLPSGVALTNVIAVAAGYEHTVALKSDGTVWAWGTNKKGQLGDGTRTSQRQPIRSSHTW